MALTWSESLEIAGQSGCQLTFCGQCMNLYSLPNLLDFGPRTFDQALSFNSESPAKWPLSAVGASEPIN